MLKNASFGTSEYEYLGKRKAANFIHDDIANKRLKSRVPLHKQRLALAAPEQKPHPLDLIARAQLCIESDMLVSQVTYFSTSTAS